MKSDKINRLVTENINLIYLVMKRFRNRGVDREDLFQIGAVGLTKAAQRFDESKGFAFSTYAVPLIIGEIQRFLRDDGMVSKSGYRRRSFTSVRKMMLRIPSSQG